MTIVRINQISKYIGQQVKLNGWVYNIRRSGKIGFLTFRDGFGLLQCIVAQNDVGDETFEVFTAGYFNTTSAIDAEVIRLQAIYDGNAYQRTRAVAYEEVKEQLDQLYHDMTAGKLDATGELHKAIKAVKDASPKP